VFRIVKRSFTLMNDRSIDSCLGSGLYFQAFLFLGFSILAIVVLRVLV